LKARPFIRIVRNALHRCHLCLAAAISRRALFREAQRVHSGDHGIQVTPSHGFFLISSLLAFAASSTFAQSALPPSAVRTRSIPGLLSADFSANEEHVAVLTNQAARQAKFTAEIEIWNLSHLSSLAHREMQENEPIPKFHGSYVRFTSDDALLVVYLGTGVIHILRTNSLDELRTIRLDLPAGSIDQFEVSPTLHLLAVHRNLEHAGKLELFDLDSGDSLRSWSTPGGNYSSGSGLAWRNDARAIAVVVPDHIRCTRYGGTVYTFENDSTKRPIIFRVSFLPGNIAFGSDDHLYVAVNSCGGYFAHWAPDLPIYDPATGRQVGMIPGDRVGIRGSIQVSRDKKILLAYADRERTTFEGFEDTLKTSDSQWQTRELPTGKLLSTFPVDAFDFPGYTFDGYRLSSSGKFALVLNSPLQQIHILSFHPKPN